MNFSICMMFFFLLFFYDWYDRYYFYPVFKCVASQACMFVLIYCDCSVEV